MINQRARTNAVERAISKANRKRLGYKVYVDTFDVIITSSIPAARQRCVCVHVQSPSKGMGTGDGVTSGKKRMKDEGGVRKRETETTKKTKGTLIQEISTDRKGCAEIIRH